MSLRCDFSAGWASETELHLYMGRGADTPDAYWQGYEAPPEARNPYAAGTAAYYEWLDGVEHRDEDDDADDSCRILAANGEKA